MSYLDVPHSRRPAIPHIDGVEDELPFYLARHFLMYAELDDTIRGCHVVPMDQFPEVRIVSY